MASGWSVSKYTFTFVNEVAFICVSGNAFKIVSWWVTKAHQRSGIKEMLFISF